VSSNAQASRRDRLLLIANRTCPCPALANEIPARARPGRTKVRIVAPALNSLLRHWVSDVDDAIAHARDRLDQAVAALRERGIDATGTAGDSDPLVAIDDALHDFAADEIIISSHPPGQSNWLERNLVERARAHYDLPVTHIVSDHGLLKA
jgi:hypothetical protein